MNNFKKKGGGDLIAKCSVREECNHSLDSRNRASQTEHWPLVSDMERTSLLLFLFALWICDEAQHSTAPTWRCRDQPSRAVSGERLRALRQPHRPRPIFVLFCSVLFCSVLRVCLFASYVIFSSPLLFASDHRKSRAKTMVVDRSTHLPTNDAVE